MNTNGTERTIIDQENAALINIVGDWIYFINNSSYGLVYKIKVDGTSRNLQDSIDHKFVNANKFGNENSNILNESLSSYQDNWVYFADRYGLFRATVDGSQIYQITQGMIRNINVVGEWVYYTVSMPSYDESNWLYKVKIDGTEKTQLNNGYCNNVLVYDDWIYYIDSRGGGKFYRIKTDGSQKSLITTEEYSTGSFNIIDDWIYYTNNGSIYKMKIDGSQKQVILQHKNAYMVGINDNWVYYKTSEMNDKGLYRVSIDGQNNSKLFDLPGSNFIFKGDSMYFCDFSNSIGWYSIYKMNIDGTGRTLLINEPADQFSISGKWLFYFHNNSISYNSVYLGSV
jgi:hypothetical protein